MGKPRKLDNSNQAVGDVCLEESHFALEVPRWLRASLIGCCPEPKAGELSYLPDAPLFPVGVEDGCVWKCRWVAPLINALLQLFELRLWAR